MDTTLLHNIHNYYATSSDIGDAQQASRVAISPMAQTTPSVSAARAVTVGAEA